MAFPNPSASTDDVDVERRFSAAGVAIPADRAGRPFAAAHRLLATQHYEEPLRSDHALLAPISLATAAPFPAFGEDAARRGGMLTNPFDVTGSPALAIPIGSGANALPLGAQVVGRPFGEAPARVTHLRAPALASARAA